MSYNNHFSASPGIGAPSTGFAASRANVNNVKPLSFQSLSEADSSISGAQPPRSSRSRLLDGLRTAPKFADPNMPSTAPATQQQFPTGLGLAASMYASEDNRAPQRHGSVAQSGGYNARMIPVADQILSPPGFHVDPQAQEQMDPNLYAQLVATNMYLADQQQRLQQQLINVQAVAQQMQGLNMGHMQQFVTPPITPQNVNMSYQHMTKQQLQPIITAVPGAQPGVYACYNPVTGQQTYFMDNDATPRLSTDPNMHNLNHSPPQQPGTPRFQVSPPPNDDGLRGFSPPKKAASPPMEVTPLPPPSAGAFRPGHRKGDSMALGKNALQSPRVLGTPKAPGFPAVGTPTTPSGFGPGQARAGEHPIRQPRGPPTLEELKAKPTSKFEGSKNFATRTRRSAVHNLVRAGNERSRVWGSRSGSMSPVSEQGEVALATSSDDDASDSACSRSVSPSVHQSVGSSRTSTHGAIGSDRPSRANSFERRLSPSTESVTTYPVMLDGTPRTSSFAAAFKHGGQKQDIASDKKAPMWVLTTSDRKKTTPF